MTQNMCEDLGATMTRRCVRGAGGHGVQLRLRAGGQKTLSSCETFGIKTLVLQLVLIMLQTTEIGNTLSVKIFYSW